MSERKYFGTDGIRGKVGSKFMNPEFILKLGYAFGKVLGHKDNTTVLIGKDTRVSGYMLESSLEAGSICCWYKCKTSWTHADASNCLLNSDPTRAGRYCY